MTVIISLAQDTTQVHTIRSVTKIMLVLKIMGNMTVSTDPMKKKRLSILLTTAQPSTVVIILVPLVYCVVKSVCPTMIGVDKTGPGPATQVLPQTILIYAGTISGRAMIAWTMITMIGMTS